jgi:zinc/manganese transport system substrate-binding protein
MSTPQAVRAARTSTLLGTALALALTLTACGGGTPAADAPAPSPAPSPPSVPTTPDVAPVALVVTTSILGDVVAQLVGDAGSVRVLMGPGVDPHGYEPSAADAAALRDADLVIANGLGLEEGLTSALEAAAADGARILTLADQLDPIPFAKDDAHDDHGHSHGHAHDDDDHDDAHDHGENDPHFWWDPTRMAEAVELVAAALTDIRPEVDWTARAAATRSELLAVDAELTALFATIPAERRRIITNHDSLGYLADRYGFEIIGTVIPGATTSAATNPRDFARLVDLVVAEGVAVIFAENTDSTVLAEQLRSEAVRRGDVTITVVRIFTDALGEPGSGADTYVGMLRTTARLVTEALTGT